MQSEDEKQIDANDAQNEMFPFPTIFVLPSQAPYIVERGIQRDIPLFRDIVTKNKTQEPEAQNQPIQSVQNQGQMVYNFL